MEWGLASKQSRLLKPLCTSDGHPTFNACPFDLSGQWFQSFQLFQQSFTKEDSHVKEVVRAERVM